MSVMSRSRAFGLDFDPRAAEYARHRAVHPGVVRKLVESELFSPDTRVLDIGCGTGNYAAALAEATNCRVSGIDPSPRMLDRARGAAPWESLVLGSAETVPFPDDSFDVVMSSDVIHHIENRGAYFREAARVLHLGGHLVTVTDSHDDIPNRRPLSSHFPETVEVELQRYPPVPILLNEMARAGFTAPRLTQVSRDYALTDIQAYRDRAFSSLLLIDEESYQRGLDRLESDLVRGPIPCISLYTIIWATAPGA